jgi:phosphoglycerate dehydrogenase-like enzyme
MRSTSPDTPLLPSDRPVRMVMLLRQDNLFQSSCPRNYLGRKATASNVALTVVRTAEELRDAMAEADAIASNEIPPGSLAKAPQVAWIHALAAGVEGVVAPEVRESDLCITNSAGTMAPEVAEHTLALILALTRRLDHAIAAQHRKEWAAIRREHPPVGLSGLTLGIAGYGRIGRAVAERARPFGLRVLGLRRKAAPVDELSVETLGIEAFEAFLERSDIVVSVLPITATTRGLFGAAAFRAMGARSLFVNVGRGAVMDEAALAEALISGTIAGAASDVFAEEPLPPSNPLWTAPNFIVSPHLGGASEQVWYRVIDLLFENVERLKRGQPPVNEVDKSAGY